MRMCPHGWTDCTPSDIIMEQYDYYGQYHNGFLNAYFGQRDVTLTTDGWNYIAINDDVYMYTGVTSVTSDQSNIGFILTNQRTKETRFYPLRRCHGDLRPESLPRARFSRCAIPPPSRCC